MTSLALDNLPNHWPKEFKGATVGAVLHPASVNSHLTSTLDVLTQFPEILKLKALFGPQHGFLGQTQDNMIEWTSFLHPKLGIPVYSLYGEHRQPTPEMFKGLQALFFDLQDVGARYYTFIWTLYLCMKTCEQVGIPIIVHDRPNPITNKIEGPQLNSHYTSFVGLHPIPVRHGKTIGELALQFKAEAFPKCEVWVLHMQDHSPSSWFDETGLPWVLPSPNMPTLDTAIVYPGQCLLEATNISEGRGTTRPFEIFGAPYLNANHLAEELNSLHLPGAYFRALSFEPTFQKHARLLCEGCQIHVLDRNSYQPYETSMKILEVIQSQAPENFKWNSPPYEYEFTKLPIEILLGNSLNTFFPHSK